MRHVVLPARLRRGDASPRSPKHGKTTYEYSADETEDIRFAFEACISEELEKERGGKVLEISMLYDLLRALTGSEDSEDITRGDVDLLVDNAKTELVIKEAEAAESKSRLAKGANLIGSGVAAAGKVAGSAINAVEVVGSKAAQVAHVDGLTSKVHVGHMPFKGMLNKKFNHKSLPDEVNFSEFFLMLTADETAKFLPDGNILKAAFNIRVLAYAFGLIDENGDNSLNYEEFSKAADALSTSLISEQLAKELWGVVAPGKSRDVDSVINFVGFVTGMAEVQADPVYSKKFNLFDTNILLSMIVDLPVSKVEEKQLLAGMDGLERMGMSAAKRSDHHEWSSDKRNEVMYKVEKRQVHMLTDDQKVAMNFVHKRNVYQGAIAGFLSAVFCAIFENVLTYVLHTDGAGNPFHCIPTEVAESAECLAVNGTCGCIGPTERGERMDPLDTGTRNDWDEDPLWPHCDWRGILKTVPGKALPQPCVDENTGSNADCDFIVAGQCEATTNPTTIVTFWGVLIGAIIIACVFEIGALYWYSIKNSVLVADALDMHLDPLNKDRAFVGLSLVRAALELGNTNNVLFGVDPLKDAGGSGAMVAVFTLVYKAKVVLTGFLVKIAIKRVLGRGGAKYALPWAAVPATAFWDGMISHLVMVEAKLRGNGVATSVEVFQDILYDLDVPIEEESEAFKMQLVRAVGCNIAKARDIYPAKEILLRHVVQELGFTEQLREKESGDLDDTELFLATMAELSGPEMKIVLEVLVLATVLDGNANKRERRLYEAALLVCAETEHGGHLAVHNDRVRKLAQDYRNMVPITKEAIQDCLGDNEHGMPMSYYWNECVHWLCSLLICI